MVEPHSKRTEHGDVSRVEYLLGVLSGLAQNDPAPAIRERLELLARRRLRVRVGPGKPLDRHSGFLRWLWPAFAAALLIILGTTATFVGGLRRSEHLRTEIQTQVAPSKMPFTHGSLAQPAAQPPKTQLRQTGRPLPHLAQSSTRRMILRLPYSDSAIDTGTYTTIRVSMSCAELVSLGFPINTSLQDRRVVAELTLGDDGLPRAISVPFPLEGIREKK
jgi:hypothetical protein